MPSVEHVNNSAPESVPEQKVPESKPLNLRPDIEFKLPDGRLVRMGKPDTPTAMLLPSVIASMTDPNLKTDPARNEFNARMSMFVRNISGKPFRPPMTAGEVGLVLHELGEDGCDIVLDLYFKHFAPLSADQIEIIKK